MASISFFDILHVDHRINWLDYEMFRKYCEGKVIETFNLADIAILATEKKKRKKNRRRRTERKKKKEKGRKSGIVRDYSFPFLPITVDTKRYVGV